MTYATSITAQGVKTRWIVRFAGINYHFATFGDSTLDPVYDDGGTHGEQSLIPSLMDVTLSAGTLDYERYLVTPTTCTITMHDYTETAPGTSLREFFARRTTGTTIAEELDNSELDITVVTPGNISTGYAYIGQECVSVSSKLGSVLTVTRGALGTAAQAHPNTSRISNKPLNWIGRKVWLALGVNDGSGWVYQDPYKVFYIESSPSFNNGVWTIRCSDALRFFDRPIYIGYTDVVSESISYNTSSDRKVVVITLPANHNLVDVADATRQDFYVKIDYEGNTAVHRGNLSTNTITIDSQDRNILDRNGRYNTAAHTFNCIALNQHPASDNVPLQGQCTIREVFPPRDSNGNLTCNSALHALRIMLSDLGNGASGNGADYDVLPGEAEAVNESTMVCEPQRRGGAGLTTDYVDTASWLSAGSSPLAGGEYIVGYDGSERLLDVLTKHFAPVMGGYIYTTDAGKLAFKKFVPHTVGTSTDYTVNDNNSDNDSIVDDESVITSRFVIAGGYDWRNGKHKIIHEIEVEGIRHDLGDIVREFRIDSKISVADFSSALLVEMAYTRRWGEGAKRITRVLPWSAHLLMPGDTISYSNSRLIDFEGNVGITNAVFELTEVSPDLSTGTVRVRAVEMPSCNLIAPVLEITAGSGNTWDVSRVASTQAIEDEWGYNPDNWIVQVISPTGSVRGTTTLNDASGTSTGTITFAAAPAGTAVGDFVTLSILADQTGTTENTALGADPTDYCHMGASNDATYKWG